MPQPAQASGSSRPHKQSTSAKAPAAKIPTTIVKKTAGDNVNTDLQEKKLTSEQRKEKNAATTILKHFRSYQKKKSEKE
ncbi:hypothetical protein BGAL_0808g00010 [Botrytis galanthina]|uniref:Uncharacterized protein n=1 Tax=Botrytis galanthina TaxID=278940 RepID=A0A4S8QHE2_9HELO|nr:hypothetical protein BGAL_0808g00010 [Botrytis galanthina]